LQELDKDLLQKVKVERTEYEKRFFEADAALQFAKEAHKSAKQALEFFNESISEDVKKIEAGIISVSLEPEHIYRVYKSGFMYYYYDNNDTLKLAHFRSATDKEKESFETGLFAVNQ